MYDVYYEILVDDRHHRHYWAWDGHAMMSLLLSYCKQTSEYLASSGACYSSPEVGHVILDLVHERESLFLLYHRT